MVFEISMIFRNFSRNIIASPKSRSSVYALVSKRSNVNHSIYYTSHCPMCSEFTGNYDKLNYFQKRGLGSQNDHQRSRTAKGARSEGTKRALHSENDDLRGYW